MNEELEFKCSVCGNLLQVKRFDLTNDKSTVIYQLEPCDICLEEAKEEGLENGFEEGNQAGYEEGYDEGVDSGRAEVINDFKNYVDQYFV